MHSDLLLSNSLLYPSDLVFCRSLPYFFFFCTSLFFTLLLQCSCLLVWKLNIFLEKWGTLAFVCASINIYAHMYMCVYMWRPESISCIIPYPFFWAWVSNCPKSPSSLCSESMRSPLSLPPQLWNPPHVIFFISIMRLNSNPQAYSTD